MIGLEDKKLRGTTKGYGILILFVLTGAVLGGILGEVISNVSVFAGIAPYLVQTYPIVDVAPVNINLCVIQLSLGFALYPNLISILGILLAIFLFKRF